MSTLKRTSLTRSVQLLITVLLALCCLLLAEKSGQYSLTSKAYQTGYPDSSSFNIPGITSQWTYYSPTQLTKSFALVGDGQGTYTCNQVGFVGEYYQGAALEYAFDIYDTSGNTRLYSSLYYDSGTLVNVGLPLVQSTDGIVYRCELYVRKKDGGNIYASDMYASAWTWYLNRTTEVQENTLPADWYGTSTVTGYNPLETMTTVASTYYIDDSVVSDSLDIPPVTESAIGQLMSIVTRILALPYLKFMLCFAVIMGLVAWFLH